MRKPFTTPEQDETIEALEELMVNVQASASSNHLDAALNGSDKARIMSEYQYNRLRRLSGYYTELTGALWEGS